MANMDIEQLRRTLDEVEDKRAAAKARLAQVEQRLAHLKRSVFGRRIPHREYEEVCEEQGVLAAEKQAIQSQLAELGHQQIRLSRDLDNRKRDDRGEKPDRLEETNRLLRLILRELRRVGERVAPPLAPAPPVAPGDGVDEWREP